MDKSKTKKIIVEGCCLALMTDCRLYSSHCHQCCLSPVPAAGWNMCCCQCTVEIAEGSIRQLEHQSCISMNSLLGHVALGCAIAYSHAEGDTTPCMFGVSAFTGHNPAHHLAWWSATRHVSAVHRWTCLPWTCDAVNKGCVVGPAGVDTKQHI